MVMLPDALPPAPARPVPLTAAQAAQAITQNERHKKNLGWGKHIGQIASLLGFADGAPDAPAFVQAVAH